MASGPMNRPATPKAFKDPITATNTRGIGSFVWAPRRMGRTTLSDSPTITTNQRASAAALAAAPDAAV